MRHPFISARRVNSQPDRTPVLGARGPAHGPVRWGIWRTVGDKRGVRRWRLRVFAVWHHHVAPVRREVPEEHIGWDDPEPSATATFVLSVKSPAAELKD